MWTWRCDPERPICISVCHLKAKGRPMWISNEKTCSTFFFEIYLKNFFQNFLLINKTRRRTDFPSDYSRFLILSHIVQVFHSTSGFIINFHRRISKVGWVFCERFSSISFILGYFLLWINDFLYYFTTLWVKNKSAKKKSVKIIGR